MIPKVSVIVPIYNAGNRLYECLSTLVNQTLREIEIICVIDAPTDGCEKIAEKFSLIDNRIRLIYNKVNLHVSESRNIGLAVAHGEFIGFSDCDDSRVATMYESLYNSAIKNNSSVVFSDALVRNNGIDCKYCYNEPTKEGVIRSLLLPMEHKNNKNYLSKSVWSSIYKKKFLVSNNILFIDQRIYLSEDTLFNLKVYLHTDKIFYVNTPFYIWEKRSDSLSSLWVDNIAVKSIAFFEIILADLKITDQFTKYYSEWIILIENSLHSYYFHYLNLNVSDKKRLANLLVKGRFPIVNRFEDLKLISMKRIKIYLLVFKLYIYHSFINIQFKII